MECACKRKDLSILRFKEFYFSPAECFISVTHSDEVFHPPQQGVCILLLVFDIYILKLIFRINNKREV